jgi:hypothetical protein
MVPYRAGMPGHSNIVHYGQDVSGTQLAGTANSGAFIALTCPHCGKSVMGAVVAHTQSEAPQVSWIRCTGCNSGVVHINGQVVPSPKVGEDVEGLPNDVAEAYDEARRTAGAGAFTSCELMCRKILMHIAVDKGDEEGKTFIAYLDFLKDSGYVTPPMIPWVDLIRSHGNLSTHRLQAASRERAMNTLTFTAQLLRLVYEMEHKAQMFVTPTSGAI